MKPAAIPRFGGGLGILEIFAKEAIARLAAGMANQQFAGLVDLGLRVIIANDADL